MPYTEGRGLCGSLQQALFGLDEDVSGGGVPARVEIDRRDEEKSSSLTGATAGAMKPPLGTALAETAGFSRDGAGADGKAGRLRRKDAEPTQSSRSAENDKLGLEVEARDPRPSASEEENNYEEVPSDIGSSSALVGGGANTPASVNEVDTPRDEESPRGGCGTDDQVRHFSLDRYYFLISSFI
jgi:hypothetical protein